MPKRAGPEALIAGDDFHRQAAARGFAVLGVHIFARFIHGLDNLIEAHARFAGTAQGHARGVNRFDRRDGVTLDARYLHLAGNRVAGQAEVMFHTDFRGDAHLGRASAQQLRQTGRGHRAGHADFALATDFGAEIEAFILYSEPMALATSI